MAWLGGRTFASLRHRTFRLYYGSHAIAFAGRWMQQIAAYWLVLELTRNPVAVGALAAFQLLPVTIFGLAAGSLVDRFDARRLIVVCEVAMAVLSAALAALTLQARSASGASTPSSQPRGSSSSSTIPRGMRSCTGSSGLQTSPARSRSAPRWERLRGSRAPRSAASW